MIVMNTCKETLKQQKSINGGSDYGLDTEDEGSTAIEPEINLFNPYSGIKIATNVLVIDCPCTFGFPTPTVVLVRTSFERKRGLPVQETDPVTIWPFLTGFGLAMIEKAQHGITTPVGSIYKAVSVKLSKDDVEKAISTWLTCRKEGTK